MEYVLVMSLSGSCMFVMVLLWKRLTREKYGKQLYYMLLKLVVLFYLLPLWFLKDIYAQGIRKHIPAKTISQALEAEKLHNMYFTYGDAIYLSEELQVKFLVGGIWLVVSMGLLVHQVLRHRQIQKQLQGCQAMDILETDRRYVEKWCEQYHIRRRVLLRPYLLEKKRNFTLGIQKPIIVYDATIEAKDRERILRHELVHIRHVDMLWSVLMKAVICIHWINPCVWVLKREFADACEMACDEVVMAGCDMQERGEYIKLIVRQSLEEETTKYGLSLSSQGKRCEKRIRSVMNMHKKRLGIVGMFGIMAMVAVNSLTVLAYPEITHYNLGVDDGTVDIEAAVKADWMYISEEHVDEYLRPEGEILYEYQFVDENGNVYELSKEQFEGEVETCASCTHNYVAGQSQMHVNKTDGGCIVYIYESSRCSLCGDLEKSELINRVEYMMCPHDF